MTKIKKAVIVMAKYTKHIYKHGFVIVFLSLVLFLTSCSLYKAPDEPIIKAPSNFKNADKNFKSYTLKNKNWWYKFGDEELNKIVKCAYANNLDYQTAINNIEIAKTYVGENVANLFPQLNANFAASRNAPGKNLPASLNTQNSTNQIYNLYNLNGSTTYEIDIWHQIYNSVKQAEYNVNLTAAQKDVVKITLTSNVVDTYLQIKSLNINLQNLQAQLKVNNEILQLNKNKYQSGLINIEDVETANMQIFAIKADINALIKQREILSDTLAYLSGKYPENFLLKFTKTQKATKVDFKKIIPGGIPAAVIKNRPDIKSALYNVYSYDYAKKIALANFFPNISLTGAYGFESASFANFIEHGNIAWNLGVNILQPVLDWGMRANQYDRAKLQYKNAVLNYKNSALNAFTEIDNALISYKKDYLILKNFFAKLNSAKEKLDSADAQYKSGVADYIIFLNYKFNYLQNKYNITAQQQVVLDDVVQIYKVLGY